MCGFLLAEKALCTKEQFLAALDRLSFRGPDATGFAETDQYFIGHQRLKILDLDDHANQPFVSSSGRTTLIYNGEIYNYRELAKSHGLSLRTSCDTEVLIELYERLGAKVLDQLIGMFAFVAIDNETGELFYARDRLGIKPLFVCRQHRVLSSEPAAIVALGLEGGIDETGLRQYLKLRAFFNGRSIYSNIESFPAGHYCQNESLRRYWSLPDGPQEPPESEELEDLLKNAVALRMRSDVPVGAFLSGGLDSSVMCLYAGDVHTWSVGFPDANEFEWSNRVAGHLSLRHHAITVQAKDYAGLWQDMVEKRREPLSVPNEVLIYAMCRAIKPINTVVISGEGADELFFGYDRIFRWANKNPWDVREFARRYSYGAHADDEIVEDAVAPFLNTDSCLQTVASFFQIGHLHGLLRRLDFASMLCGVEARVPFVDHRLVERMAGVPFDYRLDDGMVKAPLKRLVESDLPNEVVHRKKVGFPVDLAAALGRDGATYDDFLSANLQLLGIDREAGIGQY